MQKITREKGEPYDEFDMPGLPANAVTQQAFLDKLVEYKIVTHGELLDAINSDNPSSVHPAIANLRKTLGTIGIEIYSVFGKGFTLYEELIPGRAGERRIDEIVALIQAAIADGKNGLDRYELARALFVEPCLISMTVDNFSEGKIMKMPSPYKAPRGKPKLIYTTPEHIERLREAWFSDAVDERLAS